MTVRRLRWHPTSRKQVLLERLRTELDAWLQGWSTDPGRLTLELVEPQPARPVNAGWRWLQAGGRQGRLWLGAPASRLDGLGGLIADARADDALGLARRVGDRALRALLIQWAGGLANQASWQESESPSAEDQEARFGVCELRLEGAGFEARLLIDDALVDFWSPPKAIPGVTLQPRDKALGREVVQLGVVLDLGQATLAETRDLRVGDVLISGTPIDGAFHLVHRDSRVLAQARPFRQGTRRALQLDSIPKTRPTP